MFKRKRSNKELIGFNDRWLMVIGIPFTALVISLLMFNREIEANPAFVFNTFPISLFYTTVYWIVMRWLLLYCRDTYFQSNEARKRIVLEVVLVLIVYTVVKFLLDITVHDFLSQVMGAYEPRGLTMVVLSLTVCFFVLTIYESLFFYSQLEKAKLEQEELKREHIISQLEGLKNQVNPHFLFNSMNTLAQLIPEDSGRAVKFVEKLSKVYRYILEIKDQKVISLEEEVRFLNAYLFLLKERFEDNLKVEIDIPVERMQDKVLPLSLQLLIENAIKHNVISKERPLSITVKTNKGHLHVENNLQLKNQVMNSTRMGLQNIRKRYRFFTDQTVIVMETKDLFAVSLPLIQ